MESLRRIRISARLTFFLHEKPSQLPENHFHLILRSVSFGKRAIGRLSIDPMTWTILVRDFGRMFCQVAGNPKVID